VLLELDVYLDVYMMFIRCSLYDYLILFLINLYTKLNVIVLSKYNSFTFIMKFLDLSSKNYFIRTCRIYNASQVGCEQSLHWLV